MAAPAGDDRSTLEKLDDLQARRPFAYNLVTGALIGGVLALFGVHPLFAVLYALVWAALRWFLWQDDRVLRRQYEARARRWQQVKDEKRRQRGG